MRFGVLPSDMVFVIAACCRQAVDVERASCGVVPADVQCGAEAAQASPQKARILLAMEISTTASDNRFDRIGCASESRRRRFKPVAGASSNILAEGL